MKLQFKVYSPFFMLLMAVLFFSCTEENKGRKSISSNQLYIDKLEAQQKQADYYYGREDYYSAYKLYLDLKEKWQELGDDNHVGYVSLNMAAISYKAGNYTESQTEAVEALECYEKIRLTKNLPSVYIQLGVIYRKQRDYENALLSYKEVAKYIESGDSTSYYTLRNNIASVYIDSRQYNKALSILLPINKSDSVTAKPELKARILDNIGAAYFKLDNRKEALNFLKQGVAIRQTILDAKGLTSSYFNLYHFYADNDISAAKMYALQAYSISKKRKNEEDRLRALKALVSVDKGRERDKYFLEFARLDDSLKILQAKDENKFAKIKYDYKKERNKKLQLEAQQAKSELKAQQDKFVIWGLAGATIVAIMIFAFIHKTQKIKHKKDKVIEVYNTESRISKKIHDELANDIFKVMSFAESEQVQYPGQQKLIQDLDAIYTKTRDISHENNTIDTGEKFGEVLRQMLLDYKTASVNVLSTNFDAVNWNKIAAHKKIAVYRVLHELMVNMKKHSGAKFVVIKFSIENNNVVIQYTDNGRGIGAEQLIFKNGLQNAVNRISAISGSLTFESSTNGLKVNCTFPA